MTNRITPPSSKDANPPSPVRRKGEQGTFKPALPPSQQAQPAQQPAAATPAQTQRRKQRQLEEKQAARSEPSLKAEQRTGPERFPVLEGELVLAGHPMPEGIPVSDKLPASKEPGLSDAGLMSGELRTCEGLATSGGHGDLTTARDAGPNEPRSLLRADGQLLETDARNLLSLEEADNPGTECMPGELKQSSASIAATREGSLDMERLADKLLPPGGDDGIFEVLLPNGQKLGVAVRVQPDSVRYHLSTADEKLGERLRLKKMELRGQLERRMQRNVDITVL